VLAEIKSEENLKRIPVLDFSVPSSETDILEAHNIQPSAFITETSDFDDFTAVVESL